MIIPNFYTAIREHFAFTPTSGQDALMHDLAQFCLSRGEKRAFILRGYAGTGKTSVVSALVKALYSIHLAPVLVAPTGRAAKVLARYSGYEATTIHKAIYRESKVSGMDSIFDLGYNQRKGTLFIVDESSMIGTESEQQAFGSGNLLEDLIRYVYEGEDCSLLFVGDDAQLPPVGQVYSAALDRSALEAYGLTVSECTLTEVVRQALDNGVLREATALRNHLVNMDTIAPYQTICPNADLIALAPNEVVEQIDSSYRTVGMDEALIITRSNKRTNLYNKGIRARILGMEEQLQTGDRVMVSRNNYFWLPDGFIANGESLQIVRLRNEREMYGYHFVDALVRTVDNDMEMTATIWLDTLSTDTPEQNYQLQRDLYFKIAQDYPELQRFRRKLRDKIMESPYYNALQVRYAYAVTCHKSQGGQWKHVYIDAGALADKEYADIEDWRWLYTALTRASEKVFLLRPLKNTLTI